MDRANRRLEARLKHLGELRTTYERRTAPATISDEGSSAGDESRSTSAFDEPSGMEAEGPALGAGAQSGDAREEVPIPDSVIEEEIQRVLTFESSAEPLLRYVVSALREEGLIRGTEDLKRIVGAVIRVAQRKE